MFWFGWWIRTKSQTPYTSSVCFANQGVNCYHRKLNLKSLTIQGCSSHISAAKWRKKTWLNINIRKRCCLPSLSKKTNYSGQWKLPSEGLRDTSQKFLRLFTAILESFGVLFQVILGYPPSSEYLIVKDQNDVTCHRLEYKTTLPLKHSKKGTGALSPLHQHKHYSRRYTSYLLILLLCWRTVQLSTPF